LLAGGKRSRDCSLTGGASKKRIAASSQHDKLQLGLDEKVLTDGECVCPATTPKKPVLWVHSSGHNINESLPGAKVRIIR
jgi:predicted metal-dependent peptidase